ncbi:hypothetical protein PENSUB_11351 [Penicillium subrubescens]|uniref:Uncharacterized protein n=2 Tax=Penicillium subrubescens TaxID=1316194 RepID=A0A1Q5T3Z6_9EURO|nr:hypothetical protein PENSUB_11351 [Penicillium subrubescens]
MRKVSATSLEVYVKYPDAIADLDLETLKKLTSGPFAGQQAIDIYVPISILAPPTPVIVKLSVLSGVAATTILDLSPGGPTLINGVLPPFPAFEEYTFPATSLFVPSVHLAPFNTGPVPNAELAKLASLAQTVIQ